MIGCGSKVSDGDLCLYSLPGLLLETPRTYSNCCQTTSLLIHVEVSRLVLMGERIKKKTWIFHWKKKGLLIIYAKDMNMHEYACPLTPKQHVSCNSARDTEYETRGRSAKH